jgi:hypothetical protein
MPQPPQLLGSVPVLAHTRVFWQPPFRQTSLPEQAISPTPQPAQVWQAPPLSPQASELVPVEHVPGEPLQHPPLQAEKFAPPQLVVQVCCVRSQAWSAGQSVGELQPGLELQTPPVQLPLEHCEAEVQAAPFGKSGVQAPFEQKVKPGLQTLLQPPQLLLSVCSFVQMPLHKTWPPVQAAGQAPLVQAAPLGQAVPQLPQLEGSAAVVVQNPLQEVPEQASVSPAACILYSTSRFASAPVFEAQVEPVRREACSTSPAAKVMTMAPVSDQFWPGVRTKSCPLVLLVSRKTAAGQVAPVGVFATAAIRRTVIA